VECSLANNIIYHCTVVSVEISYCHIFYSQFSDSLQHSSTFHNSDSVYYDEYQFKIVNISYIRDTKPLLSNINNDILV
jgi:hypothetical protein